MTKNVEVDLVRAFPSVLAATANATPEEERVFNDFYPTCREGKKQLYSLLNSSNSCTGSEPYHKMCRTMRTWCDRTEDCSTPQSFAASVLNDITKRTSAHLCTYGLRVNVDFVAFADQVAVKNEEHVAVVTDAMNMASTATLGVPLALRTKDTDFTFDERRRLSRNVPTACTFPKI